MAARQRATILTIAAIVAMMAMAVLLSPVAYDTDHFADTHFILGAAWRQYLGLVPTVDFQHFYGGFTSWVVAKAYVLFGPSVHAFDFALLMLLAGFSLASAAVFWRRVSGISAAMALLVIATLILTRHPLETAQSLTRLFSSHAFLYNRIGLVILVIVGIYAALPSRSRGAEILGGAVSGGLLVAVLLTKPTFIVLLPAVFLALAVQARWAALAATVLATFTFLMISDPWGARWFASFQYGQFSVGDRPDATVISLLRKAVQVPLAQPIVLTLVIATIMALLWTRPRPWAPVLSIAFLAAGGLGMATTMGGGGAFGQLGLPIFAMAMLACTELAQQRRLASEAAIMLGTLILTMGFSLPHVANLFGATIEGWVERDRILISNGPLEDYLSVVEDAATEEVTQYEMMADGIAALQQFGDLSDRGIIATNGITLDFALQSRPVTSYPLWQRPNAPELAADMPFPPDADIVLLGRGAQADMSVGPLLQEKMEDDFSSCGETAYWRIFVRNDMVWAWC